MKKAAACFLVLLLLSAAGASTGASAAAVHRVGVSVGDYAAMGGAVREIMNVFTALETGQTKYELFLADAKGSAETQLAQLRNFIAQGVEMLLVNPVDTTVAAELMEDHTPLVLFGQNLITLDVQGVHLREGYEELLSRGGVCCTGSTPRDAGLAQSEILAAQKNGGDIDGDGVIRYVLIQGGMSAEESRMRTEYSLMACLAAGKKVECLADLTNYWGQAQGRQACSQALTQFGSQIDAVICSADSLAMGASTAIRESGLEVGADIILLGIDGLDSALSLIQKGQLTGTVKPDADAEYRLAAEIAAKILAGETPPDYNWAPYRKLTAENVNTK